MVENVGEKQETRGGERQGAVEREEAGVGREGVCEEQSEEGSEWGRPSPA